MIRIHFTTADFAQVRFAPRPAPLQELNVALMKMCRPDDELLFGRWRRRLLRSLPPAVLPLRDVVPAEAAPAFLDVFSDTLKEGADTVRATRPDLVRSEMERVYARQASPAPLWIRGLHRGDAEAWQLLVRAQRAAFDTALRPVWPLVQDLHQSGVPRHALAVAEHGIGAALTALVPGRPAARERLGARGALRAGHRAARSRRAASAHLPLDRPAPHLHLPGRPLTVTYPAGPGLPLPPAGADGADDALAGVLGRTRVEILLLLADEHTTSELARRLGVSNATVSAHTAALRGAGLITTVRAGRAVLHRRTALGSLLVRRRGGTSSTHG